MRLLVFIMASMVLLMPKQSLAESAGQYDIYFKQQALSLFSEGDVRLESIENVDVINTSSNGFEVIADLRITPLRSKGVIIESVKKRLLKEYMNPQIPASLSQKATMEEKQFYKDMTTQSIAEQIVKASLGDTFAVNSPIFKPRSRIVVLQDETGEFLMILGKKVRVHGE